MDRGTETYHSISLSVGCHLSGDLIPADPLAAARCDSIYEAAQEMAGEATQLINVVCGEEFECRKQAFFGSERMRTTVANLIRTLSTGGPFFFGTQPYYCDFAVYHHLDMVRLLAGGRMPAFASHRAAIAFLAAVEALPRVGEYLRRRPDCIGIGTEPLLQRKERMQDAPRTAQDHCF